jgi:hypothetical protein
MTIPARRHMLEVDGVRLEVDAQVGGRVTSLRIGEVEVLSGPDAHADNYGSTFWTSPQRDWSWPPPAEIDSAPYASSEDACSLTVVGAPHVPLGVRVSKRFVADAARRAFSLEYEVHNVTETAKTYAPWEVTRVRPGGLTFFPAGQSPPSGTLKLDERAGASWYAHDPAALPAEGQKAFADGQGGVLAHVVAAGFLYMKSFESVPLAMQAPGETALEIYACPRYVELEVQGPYRAIAPGGSARWTVGWYLRKLPEGVAASAGSSELLAFAAGVLAGSR